MYSTYICEQRVLESEIVEANLIKNKKWSLARSVIQCGMCQVHAEYYFLQVKLYAE